MKALWLALICLMAVPATPALAEGEHLLEDEYGNPVISVPAPKPQPARRRAAPKPKPAPAPAPLPAEVEKALTPAIPAIPPAQIIVVAPPAPPAPLPEEMTLVCQTQTSRGNRVLSQGGFYLRIMPSAVFEDQADFRFAQIDPAHDSLIRKSRCIDLSCLAQVRPDAYYLISQPDKKHPLRLTLERRTGTFTAEYGVRNRISEQGYCQPLSKATPLF